MARRHPRFWEDLYADDYFKLELSKYDFKDANEIESSRTYCTREIFRRLSEITSTHTLILSNLSVRESSERTPRIIAGRALDLDISSFYARNLSEGFLRALFRECTLDAQFATFEGCIFPENTSEVGYFYLTLKGLPQDARPERMLKRKLLEPFVLSARFKRDVRIQIAGIYRRHRCVFTSPHVLNIEISYTDASIRLVLFYFPPIG